MPRSLLFVPALRPERVEKAAASGADIICVDLEDSIAPDRKNEARGIAMQTLGKKLGGGVFALRINPINTREGQEDVAALAASGAMPAYVMVPKIDSEADLADVRLRLGTTAVPFIPIIETSAALEGAHGIARAVAPGGFLFFGAMDLAAELGCALEWEPLVYARGRLIHAAAGAGIEAMDTPYPDIADETGAVDEARLARKFGFTGKAAIHPKHIPGIHAAFAPSADEIAWARRVRDAWTASSGAVQLDGKMIDRPVLRAADRTLAIAKRLGL